MRRRPFHLPLLFLAVLTPPNLSMSNESVGVSNQNQVSPAMVSSHVTRAAIAQLRSTNSKYSNLINVAKCAGWAKDAGANMLFLPECLGFIGDNPDSTLEEADPTINLDEHFPKNEEIIPQSVQKSLSDAISCQGNVAPVESRGSSEKPNPISIVAALQFIARESGLWISGGGIHTCVPSSLLTTSTAANARDERKIFNTHVIIDGAGDIKCCYHKIHLFDVSIPNRVQLLESRTTAPGNRLVVCDSPIGKLGLSICYDVRFSEMYVELVKEGAQILLVPSAFTVPTGKAHWHALLRARAIESQCYVIAAAQVGKHNDKRESYGHSVVYDPWGELLADAGGSDGLGTTSVEGDSTFCGNGNSPVREPSIILCDIDLERVSSVRQNMPIHEHRANAKFSF